MDKDVLINKGRDLILKKKYREAIEVLSKALNMDSDNATICNIIGRAYYYIGKYEEAIKFFERSLEGEYNYSDRYNLFPSDTLMFLGWVYEKKGDYEKAIQLY